MSAIKRASPERRSGKSRRRIFSLHRFFHSGSEKKDSARSKEVTVAPVYRSSR